MQASVAIILAGLALAYAAPKLERATRIVKPHLHIIGGDEAKPHSVPYIAFLNISLSAEAPVFSSCAGTLLSEYYILTTAHCLDGALALFAILGAHNYLEKEETQEYFISDLFTIHKDYDPDTLDNDIAVIELLVPAQFNDAVQPVTLPGDSEEEYVGDSATVSGWGVTDLQGTNLSDVLNFVQLEVISNEACASYYGDFITSKILCTAPKANTGTCNGDSGGPLINNGVLIGITDFVGTDCTSSPAGFVRISKYIDWLKANTDI